MAMVLLGSAKCPLCGQVLQADQPIVLAPPFLRDPGDPLYRFSDSGMHRACFLSWDLRGEFVSRFNEAAARRVFGNGRMRRMRDDGTLVEVGAPGRDRPPSP
jgi:hypothetical protein